MSGSVLLVEKNEGVATLTLNRPDKMNALSRELRKALVEAFVGLQADTDVGACVVTGAGRAFCAGLDLKELSQTGIGGTIGGNAEYDLVKAMAAFDRPIIGAINGVAVTGGFELALACDILIASPEARFADTHARVGIMPGWGLSQKLPRMVGIGRAKELSFTGNYLSAEQAAEWGLVNRVVPADELVATCQKLAADTLSCEPDALRRIKSVIDDGYATTFADGLALEIQRSVEHATTVSADDIGKRREAVQKRGRAQSS